MNEQKEIGPIDHLIGITNAYIAALHALHRDIEEKNHRTADIDMEGFFVTRKIQQLLKGVDDAMGLNEEVLKMAQDALGVDEFGKSPEVPGSS